MNNKSVAVVEQPAPAEYSGGLAVSLARAEVDQQITTARTYPRSISRAVEHILELATLDEQAAAECIFALPRGKDESGRARIIKGPSIRLAEIVANQWGNCRVGSRVVVVDRFEKFIEAEGVFHDLETNMATTVRIRRGIVDKNGKLYREDMIVMAGNAACAIAKRNAVLQAVPRGVWRKAYSAVEAVIAGDVKTLVSRRRSALATLAAEYKISADRVFAALEIGGEEDIDIERLSILSAMRTSLKNGEASVDELFPQNGARQPKMSDKLDAIAAGGNGEKLPSHDPETGEIHSDAETKSALEDPSGEKAAAILAEKIEDRETKRILDAARAKAMEGALKFKYWHARLHQTQADRLAPFLDQLREAANAVDAKA
jgi:hypothetical protein